MSLSVIATENLLLARQLFHNSVLTQDGKCPQRGGTQSIAEMALQAMQLVPSATVYQLHNSCAHEVTPHLKMFK
jgi:hypothetical protein